VRVRHEPWLVTVRVAVSGIAQSCGLEAVGVAAELTASVWWTRLRVTSSPPRLRAARRTFSGTPQTVSALARPLVFAPLRAAPLLDLSPRQASKSGVEVVHAHRPVAEHLRLLP